MDDLLTCLPPYICFVRHGETEYSATRRYNGTTDVGLTANGEKTARLLQPVLARVPWTTVLCSSLQRARRTAMLAGFQSPEIVDGLRECDYGDYEGKTTEEILDLRREWDFWRDGCPGGESPNAVAARLQPLLPRLLGHHGRILIFSHSHVIRIVCALLLGLDPRQGAIFSLDPGKLNIIRIHRGRPEIALWNAGRHIETSNGFPGAKACNK